MNCNCLETIRAKLAKHHNAGRIDFDLVQTIDPDTLELGKELPPLRYSYKVGKKAKKGVLGFIYCPFCGKK